MWRKHQLRGTWNQQAGVRSHTHTHRRGESTQILYFGQQLYENCKQMTMKWEFRSERYDAFSVLSQHKAFKKKKNVRGDFCFGSGLGRCFILLEQKEKSWNSAESNRVISRQWQKQSNWQSFDCENRYSGAYFTQGQWNVSYHAHSSLPRTHIEGCSLA